MVTYCRDCSRQIPAGTAGRCPHCGSPRRIGHPELDRLAIAHIDCDAFYATIEKRDRPELADRPVIVGGGQRGVVAAACYVARLHGVRSAMPMFKALAACPDAVVIRPDMAKYAAVGGQVRTLMQALTPLVQPLSIDEAFLDLSGTAALHGCTPAQSCLRLARRVEQEIGITVSIGLSYAKFLAKMASDLDKPRGFAAVGRAEAPSFLAGRPVGLLPGVGQRLEQRLAADGIATIGQLAAREPAALMRRYGSIGRRLSEFSRGIDRRPVDPDGETKSISAETTFNEDLTGLEPLLKALWPLCETVSRRLKAHGLAGRTIVLKLKTAEFRVKTRSHSLDSPTQLADTLFRTGRTLLAPEAEAARYRLIGIGCSELTDTAEADQPDLLDVDANRRRSRERAIDAVRDRLGRDAITLGRSLPERR